MFMSCYGFRGIVACAKESVGLASPMNFEASDLPHPEPRFRWLVVFSSQVVSPPRPLVGFGMI